MPIKVRKGLAGRKPSHSPWLPFQEEKGILRLVAAGKMNSGPPRTWWFAGRGKGFLSRRRDWNHREEQKQCFSVYADGGDGMAISKA